MLKNYMKNQQKSSPENQGIYFLPSVLCISQEKKEKVLFFQEAQSDCILIIGNQSIIHHI